MRLGKFDKKGRNLRKAGNKLEWYKGRPPKGGLTSKWTRVRVRIGESQLLDEV